MELRLQPKPEVEILPADRGIVSRKQYFVKKKFEKINKYFFSGHLIRPWKPKAELIYPPFEDEYAIQYEYDFNRDVQNCFVEDYAEEVYLRTPPPCFVIIGKCGQSINKLSREIAQEFGSVLIQADDIVNQVIKTKTETSKILDRLLRLGVSLTLNFILALMSFLAHTAEARHRGYVLCGLPGAPLLQDLPVVQQFNYLFTWENRPTVFINVLFNDEDLFKERTNLFCEIKQAESEKRIFYHSKYEECVEEEEKSDEDEDDDLLPIKEDTFYERDIDISPSRPWFQLPKDEETRVWTELELFAHEIKPAIKLIQSRVDPQYYITVDSRVGNEFELVLARLRLLQIWKVPVAKLLFEPPSVSDTENELEKEENTKEAENDYEMSKFVGESPETAFLSLFAEKTLSPKYRWELSHYNYICPVSLREGEVVEGNPEFAVVFLKYIYFLRNAESVNKFLQNPRAYVLPVRPKPLCRFFVLGYPYSGKTNLAQMLSEEFSIPVINLTTILRNDLERKKFTYQEFCRQKAECREIIRLTSQAWRDWRLEEEQRINLIEDWILFIQVLLSRRIKEFYSSGSEDTLSATEIRPTGFSTTASSEYLGTVPEGSREDLGESCEEVVSETCSEEVPALKPPDSCTEVPSDMVKKDQDSKTKEKSENDEVNMLLSSIWKSFTGEKPKYSSHKTMGSVEIFGEYDDKNETFEFDEDTDDSDVFDWCSLLPPQSLSSFLISKKPYTTRQKRQSFKVFLEAAAKVYWEPSKLKSQFAKWRIPCFMDIPLCEIFLDNPLMLLHYIPSWLKERPLIPDPIDPKHPSVIEAGRRAYEKANCISIKQNEEEVGILLRDAIEKAEREGMRVTGEVVSPGGWVVDNMTLDLKVWNKLLRENIFPDHIYILIDTEPEWRRIINLWWDLCGKFRESNEDLVEKDEQDQECTEEDSDSKAEEQNDMNIISGKLLSEDLNDEHKNVIQHLMESVKAIAEGDELLDEIYGMLMFGNKDSQAYIHPFNIDPFSQNFLQNNIETHKEESICDEAFLTQQTFSGGIRSGLFSHEEELDSSFYENPLGVQLEIFTDKFLEKFKDRFENIETKPICPEYFTKSLQFFILLLSIPDKLYKLKEWLNAIGRSDKINEIDITGRSVEEVFLEILNDLMKPFIKKPRELESFEIEEINIATEKEYHQSEEGSEVEQDEMKAEGEEDEEDVRIFGESGKLCIVNLERDIFLLGKPEIALRYYGKLYYFWNEDCKKQFIEEPEKYAPYYSAIRCYPPLRVFMMGPVGSGKSSFAEIIAKQCSIGDVDYPLFIIKNLVPHLEFTSKKITALTDQKLLLAEDDSEEAKLAKEHFKNIPYEMRRHWLENSFYTNNSEVESFMEKVLQKNEPKVYKSFPDLTYMNVESITNDHGDDYTDVTQKPSANLPETPFISMKEIDSMITNYVENKNDLDDDFLDSSLKVLWNKEPYITQGFILDGFPLRYNDVKTIIKNNWIPDVVVEISITEEEVIERNIDALMELWDTKLKHEIMEEKLLEDSLHTIQRSYLMIKRNEMIKEKRRNDEAEAFFDTSEADLYAKAQIKESQYEEDTVSENQYVLKNLKSDDLKIFKVANKPSMKKFEIHNKKGSDMLEPLEKIDLTAVEEIEKNLKEKFPLFVFNPVFESYNAGKARIIANLTQSYKADMDEIDKIKTAFKDISIPWVEVDGLRTYEEIERELQFSFSSIKKRENIKGEFAFTMKMEMAEILLEQGFYFLSKFGRWCPVQIYRMKNPIHMYRPLNAKRKVTPIAYRNYIYFVAGDNEKKLFLEDPIKYTFNEPHHPNIPLRIAVIGPPKSGKSTLCKRLKTMFDLKIVTMGSALRFALEKAPHSTLAKTINSYLQRGCFLPLSLKVEALMLCLNDPSCVTQGFVFDGMPFDAAFTQSLAENGKLPFVIICLTAESEFGKINRKNLDLQQFRLPYKNRTNLDTRYNDWNQTYKRFALWNENTFNNLYEVNAKLSVVDIFYQAYDIIRKSFFGILNYVEHCVSDRALPLQYLCVSQHEYELRKSSFHNSCPVCWTELKRLKNYSDPPPRSGLVQYLNHFYWICPEHMEKFLENPKRYYPPNALEPPEKFPKTISRREILQNLSKYVIHGHGRCPVTRTDFPSHLDWEGSYDFAAFYDGEVYLCKNKEMLERFLAMPWRYCKADTTFEVNRPAKSQAVEELGPLKITSLPPIGFLEQTVSDLIHECLQVLGVVRPLYPNISVTATGCTFVALYLKVYNKKSRSSYLVKEYLDYMIRFCQPGLFLVEPIRYPEEKQEIGQEGFEPDEAVESDVSSTRTSVSETSIEVKNQASDVHRLDFEAQTDRKIWSAAYISDKFSLMKITSEDSLIEIPEVPKINVVLKYQTYTLRACPLPPISNCITYIYTCKKNMRMPEKFNYNTLHQPLPLFSTPFAPKIPFNPEKQFGIKLYEENQPESQSKPNLYKAKRTVSDPVAETIKLEKPEDPISKLLDERFFPRFQLLDRMCIPDIPQIPKVVEVEPIHFNPHREYAYTVLFSEFFCTTQVLRCYEWDESVQFLEYADRLDKNLGLPNIPVDYLFKPQKPAFMKSRTSIDSYQAIFDAASKFYVTSPKPESEFNSEISQTEMSQKSSLINFLQLLILEKLEEIFEKVSHTSLSYDSFEFNVIPSESDARTKYTILIKEILPYPPLPWDIISRPYYSYLTISSIFQMPPLDDIAHKRHISLLDGLTFTTDDIQFVSYPSTVRGRCERNKKKGGDSKVDSYYFIYDFFNLPWTSFLTYPYSIAYNMEMGNDFFSKGSENNENEESNVNLD